MSFGSGFLQGLQVVGDHMRREELMKQRKEDRDREQYGRDLTALMNDWQNSKGDRSDDEFASSNEFAALVKRHANSKVFSKALQQGNTGGRTTKLRDVVQDASGRNVLIVDTYDKDGALISRGRPVTEARGSLEANPNDKVMTFSNKDLYNGMLGILKQSDDYVDMRAVADRYENEMVAQDNALYGLGAEPPPVTPVDPGPAPTEKTTKDALVEAATPPEQREAPDEETAAAEEEAAAASFDNLSDLEAKETTLASLNANYAEEAEKYNKAATSYYREMGGMSLQQRQQAEAALEAQKAALEEIDARIEEVEDVRVDGEQSTAYEVGSAVREGAEGALTTMKDAATSLFDMVTDNPVTNTFSDLVRGVAGAEPRVEGQTKAEEFEADSDKQADAATINGSFQDLLNGKPGVSLKPKTVGQDKRIKEVNAEVAQTVASQKQMTRKLLMQYRKAQRAQIIHGDVTPAEAKASYNALLAAMKAKEKKYQFHVDSKTGIITASDPATGRSFQTQGAGGSARADAAAEQAAKETREYSKLTKMADTMSQGDAALKDKYTALIDNSRAAMQIVLNQPAAYGVFRRAIKMQEAAVADKADWNLWVSVADAEAEFPSVTPFISAQLLNVPMKDAPLMGEFGKRLAAANGGDLLTEADWVRVSEMAEFAASKGLSGEAAMDYILSAEGIDAFMKHEAEQAGQ